jgi:hypothetical protein
MEVEFAPYESQELLCRDPWVADSQAAVLGSLLKYAGKNLMQFIDSSAINGMPQRRKTVRSA